MRRWAFILCVALSVTAATTGVSQATDGGRVLGGLVLHPQAYARAKAAANAQAAHQRNGGAKPVGGGGGSAAGWDGQYENDLTPGDPTGAIGPTRYIELVNVRYGIYNRDGTPAGGKRVAWQGTLGSLVGTNASLSDPQILWDPLTQRFYYIVLNISTNVLMYGFSKTASPSSNADFCRYYFGSWGSDLPDYPKIGSTRDFILAGVNRFASDGSTYLGSDVGWITKPTVNGQPTANALSTCPGGGELRADTITHLRNADGTDTSTPVPAIQTDPDAVGTVVGTADATVVSADGYVSVFAVSKDPVTGAAVLGAPATVPIDPFGVPASAPQLGTSATLDTLDGRLEKAVSGFDPSFGVNAVWTAHAVFGGAGSEERWYEIDAASGVLLRSGRVSDPNLFVWNGAVSPDRAVGASLAGSFGDSFVVGFNTSSVNTDPALRSVSSSHGGAVSAFTLAKSSAAGYVDYSCSPCRWGDYSSATPDPAATGSAGAVWLSGEYNTSSGGVFSAPWRSWNWRVTL